MSLRFLLRKADYGYLQASANDFGDLSHRSSLFSHRVVSAASSVLLERKPVETGNIENMRRRPAIESLANVCRRPLFTSPPTHGRDEALLDGVMHLRQTHHRHIYPSLPHRSAGDLRQPP